jgi:hypothetical protein
MRIGIEIPTAAGHARRMRTTAALADRLGIDLLYLADGGDVDPIVAAAGLSAVTRSVRIAAETRVTALANAVHLAERAAVCDQILGGRLILVLHGDEDSSLRGISEAVAEATLARPFRVARDTEVTATVMPFPLQPVLPIWVSGRAARETAGALALSFVGHTSHTSDQLKEEWSLIEARGGPWTRTRLNRPARRYVRNMAGGELDVAATVSNALRDRAAWGMDVALFAPPAEQFWTTESLITLTTRVRPRLQLASMPVGIEEFWDKTVGKAPIPELPAPFGLS